MPKTPKIDVITATLTVHIPVGRGDSESVHKAYAIANDLLAATPEFAQATLDTRLNRVPAPEPKAEASEPELAANDPADDGLDIPERLRRTAETEPAAAE